jgi:fibronectin type 3 domain-containing protein
MVTVDVETGNNLVIWEKKGSAPVSSYNIYRESIVAGEYEQIGHLPKDSLSIFLDTVSDPKKQAFIYKITAIDAEGFESSLDLCKPHKTIHLITSVNATTGDAQLEWDQYYGFTYGTYYIYRSLTESNFSIIHSMSSSTSAYTDANPEELLYYYRISVERPEDCVPAGMSKKADSGPYSHAMSNTEDNRLQITGLNELNNVRDLTLFPNPFTERTTIRFPDPGGHTYTLRILDLTGKVLRIDEIAGQPEFILERRDLENGCYIIELKGNKLFREKMIIE